MKLNEEKIKSFEKIKIIDDNNSKNSFRYLYFSSFIFIFIIFIKLKKFLYYDNNLKNIYLDKYEPKILNDIKRKLINNKCLLMARNQPEFLNGVVRKFKPKKIVEIGVYKGGSTIIMLNAIKDIKNSHIYSIDLNNMDFIGSCIPKFFPKFLNNWTLFKGNIAAKFIEQIGKGIDMVFIDSAHFEPGEILDFIIVLPFLNEEALVVIHDIGSQIVSSNKTKIRAEWAPYLIFNIIRGKKFLPSGNGILTQDIGAIKLEKNQKNFIHDYFRALGGQWEYFLKNEHIELMRNFIK